MNNSSRYETVLAGIEAACLSCGRKREDVQLIAVSKFHPVQAILEVARAGQLDFGENYVQEVKSKKDALSEVAPNLRWHMIGHVQSRKAAQVAGKFALLHTLDSIKLANCIERNLLNEASQDVLIEVNIADEPQKSGIKPTELPELAQYVIASCPHLKLRGLMCLPPVFDDGEAARPYFAKLRNLRDELEKQTGAILPELSMGMSGDYAAAIAEGATIVRIGTSIFGPRPLKKPV